MATGSAYEQLIALLDHNGARYRLIDHAPEGRTELVSALRGHAPSMAAKCMILMAKFGKKEKNFVLCVLPGDRRLDLAKVRIILGAAYLSFAAPETAETLGETVIGTILPFPLNSNLQLIVDPLLERSDEIFFNAGRLDRSVALKTEDYIAIAKPRLQTISE
jgi:Ala-tRNA(Pro) deacylase